MSEEIKSFLTETDYAALDEVSREYYVTITPEEATTLTGDESYTRQLSVGEVAGYRLDKPDGRQAALNSERDVTKGLTKQLKAFEGIDPVQAKADRVKVGEMKDWKPEDQVAAAIDEKVSSVTSQFEDKIKSLQTGHDVAVNALQDRVVDDAINDAIDEHGGKRKLLFAGIKLNTRTTRDDEGKVSVYLVDEKGQTLMSKGLGSHGNMEHGEYVGLMKKHKDFLAAFLADGGPGTGGTNSEGAEGGERFNAGGNATTITISRKDAKNPIKYRAARDLAAKENKKLVLIGEA